MVHNKSALGCVLGSGFILKGKRRLQHQYLGCFGVVPYLKDVSAPKDGASGIALRIFQQRIEFKILPGRLLNVF